MHARNLRKLWSDPIWFVMLGSFVAGVVLGNALAHEQTSDLTESAVGRAWRGDPSETRATLGALLGFQITILTIVVSINAMVIKGAAYQYSPRLVPLYLKSAPIRRELPMFVLLAAYILAAVRELGLVADNAERPRVVVSVAVVLIVIALSVLIVDLFQTIRFVRVERVLRMVRDATYAAAKRVSGRIERLPLQKGATLAPPIEASALVARESGYLVDVDLRRLTRLAERAGLRARIAHAIGDYVDEGEVIGWVAADDESRVDPRLARKLASTLVFNSVRELDHDPAFGIRIIVDVANRSLSSSANDPYTARQALNQLRSVLRHVGRLPLGDWNVVDRDGRVRVSVMGTQLGELLSVAVIGPLHFGVDYPEVLEGLFEIVMEVGLVARDAADRAAARGLLGRIEELAMNCAIDPQRLQRLREEAEPVRRSLEAEEGPVRG